MSERNEYIRKYFKVENTFKNIVIRRLLEIKEKKASHNIGKAVQKLLKKKREEETKFKIKLKKKI